MHARHRLELRAPQRSAVRMHGIRPRGSRLRPLHLPVALLSGKLTGKARVKAFEAIAAGQARSYPAKFPGIPRILTEDLGLAAAAWIRAEPAREGEILARLRLLTYVILGFAKPAR